MTVNPGAIFFRSQFFLWLLLVVVQFTVRLPLKVRGKA
jgi:hypothetical protein